MKVLGIDTSNYATSAAVFDSERGEIVVSATIPLEVKKGSLGLRQSDAVFAHTKNIPGLFERLAEKTSLRDICAVGVSDRPRDSEGSYMPCFLAGVSAASAVSRVLDVPLCTFSHQAGHVMAALYGTGFSRETRKDFYAFHVSGGTTDLMSCTLDAGTLNIETAATSLDLLAGQVVDRVGAKLGLDFPAGEELSKLASDSDIKDHAKPVLKGLDCCLSGLENQCAKLIDDNNNPAYVARYCLNSIAEVIAEMARRVAVGIDSDATDLIFAGGVMSSNIIRDIIVKRFKNAHFCDSTLSCDNAVGTAILASIFKSL